MSADEFYREMENTLRESGEFGMDEIPLTIFMLLAKPRTRLKAGEISNITKLSRSYVYNALNSLMGRGIVIATTERPMKYYIHSVPKVISGLRRQHEETGRQHEETAKNFLALERLAANLKKKGLLDEEIESPKNIFLPYLRIELGKW